MSALNRAYESVEFPRGLRMKNRFMVAPMTNLQSHDDGVLSDDEYHWLEMRARGGFGAVMTCAAHVQADGQCWPGQLGVYDDRHIEGLTRLATGLRAQGSISIAQLFHGGIRVPSKLIGGRQPVGPSDDEEIGARAMTESEIETLIEDFIAAAARCERAGFDGVELHGAHGYLICQFLSGKTNRRTDDWGGTVGNQQRILMRILEGVRERCGDDFCVGVRLSLEGYGLNIRVSFMRAALLAHEGLVDFLDISLWDSFKNHENETLKPARLIDWAAGISNGNIPIGVAGKIGSRDDVMRAMDAGVDFVLVGRGAILHHDFPERVRNPDFAPRTLPVPRAVLREEGLSETFVDYMARWPDFVADEEEKEA